MKDILLLLCLVVMQVSGYTALRYGLKQGGDLELSSFTTILNFGLHVFFNPWFLCGIALLILSLLLYLVAISRLDLSYVLPIIASNYVLTTLVGWLILGEKISPSRWVGTLLVTSGVLLVGFSEYWRKNKQSKRSSGSLGG